MGFSSSLQGSSEALLSRQDAEIRLVENIRRCMAIRIKADREYAIHLNAFLLQASPLLKSVERGLFTGSSTLGAWRTFVNETEKLVRHIKENADYLATSTIEKVNHLYNEKKQNRKFHAEEHGRIHSELSRLSDSVEKTKMEYERVLEAYQVSKVKYNDALAASAKGKGSSSKRSEEVKEKYLKVSRRLQSVHNDYVLLLSEASEFERDMRTILLPGLLEHQQAVQEGFVEKLKIILSDLHRFTNNANKKCSEIQYRIEKSVGSIRPGEEYLPFIESHKSTPPDAIHFTFDEGLSLGIAGIAGLSPQGLSLNEHTLEPLRARLRDNEARLGDLRVDLKDRQTQIIQLEAEMSVLGPKSDALSRNKAFALKKKVDGLKKELQEFLCMEQKLFRQNELILSSSEDSSLDLLGGGSLPKGGGSSNNSVSVNNLTPLDSSGGGCESKKVMNVLFKSLTLKKAASCQSMSEGVSMSGPEEEEEPHQTNNTPRISVSSPDLPESEARNHCDLQANNSSSVLSYIVGRPLEEELWFHGVLPRGEVVRLLQTDGDFLVRETIRNEEKQIVLSVMWGTPKHFIVQTSPEGLFRFEGPPYGTVQELIIHQYYSGTSVTSRSGAILKSPVLREDWELNNDDVELLEKIGRGNFGDVYRARLTRSCGLPVAVKTCKITLPEEQKKKFLGEGRILKQYDHPNIVKFIGICVQKQPIMIVMELVPGGSLLNFLREKGSSLHTKSLIGMCLDAAAGMKYLESKNCIHRDLAARNCLVGENNSVKISDFGMSREEEEYTVSDGLKQIPIKWTAPEALNYGKYTSLCDVWSFGVLCWEVFSRGGTPYQGMTNTRAREKLDSGYRMPSPENTPEEMYKLMISCWHYNPDDRPHFEEIHSTIDLLYSRTFEPLRILRSFSRTSLTNRIFSEYGTITYNKWLRSLLKRFHITGDSEDQTQE